VSCAIDRRWLPVSCADAGRRQAFLIPESIARVNRAFDGQLSEWANHDTIVPLAATFGRSLGLFETSAER
jgi:hypothetical protein